LKVSCYYCSFDLQHHPYDTVSKLHIDSYKLLGKPGRFRYTALHGLLNVGQIVGKIL
jgi:hypothetical protein